MVRATVGSGFKWEPAVWLQVANLAIALLVSFNLLSGTIAQVAALVVSGGVTLVTAALTRPLVLSAFTGVAQTFLTAYMLLYPNQLNETQEGAILAFVSVVLGLLLRSQVTPTTKEGGAA